MSEPIVLRSEAITSVVNRIDGVDLSPSSGSSEELQTLSSDVSASQSSITNMKNDIATLKNNVLLIQEQIRAIAESLEGQVTLDDIQVVDPDAPTAADGENDAPVYTVGTGTLNSNVWNVNSTSFCRHYTFDNLHVVLVNAAPLNDTMPTTLTDYASFSALPGYTGHGYLPAFHLSSCPLVRIEGNKLRLMGNNVITKIDTSQCYTYQAWWFDRSADSKLFTFEDGSLITTYVSANSPHHALHAQLGNLHFLSISTQAAADIPKGTTVNVCSFLNNLRISTGVYMGNIDSYTLNNSGGMAPGLTHSHYLTAPNTTTIAMTASADIPAGSYLVAQVMWIDAQTAQEGCTVENAKSTFLNSNTTFAKWFTYGHLNMIQIYGGHSEKAGGLTTFSGFANPFEDAHWYRYTTMQCTGKYKYATSKNGDTYIYDYVNSTVSADEYPAVFSRYMTASIKMDNSFANKSEQLMKDDLLQRGYQINKYPEAYNYFDSKTFTYCVNFQMLYFA